MRGSSSSLSYPSCENFCYVSSEEETISDKTWRGYRGTHEVTSLGCNAGTYRAGLLLVQIHAAVVWTLRCGAKYVTTGNCARYMSLMLKCRASCSVLQLLGGNVEGFATTKGKPSLLSTPDLNKGMQVGDLEVWKHLIMSHIRSCWQRLKRTPKICSFVMFRFHKLSLHHC